MRLQTEFNIKEKVFIVVWCIKYSGGIKDYDVIGPFTIGKITVEHTDSPGREGEEVFDNYKPQQDYEETYMCVETGIGSGQCYSPENMFRTRFAANEKCKSLNEGEKQ